MGQVLDLHKMSVTERIMMLNEIWQSLETENKNFESPKWHEEVLQSRQKKVENGTVYFKSFETVKQELKAKFQ